VYIKSYYYQLEITNRSKLPHYSLRDTLEKLINAGNSHKKIRNILPSIEDSIIADSNSH